MKLTQKKDITFLTILCSIAYFVSYISRINLSAVLVEIIGSGYAERSVAALALTVCSVTYGVGQLISGYLGDKFKPQSIIFVGFLITAVMNISVSILPGGKMLIILWAINGFAQSFMWPPLVKILSSILTADDYKKACVKVSWGSSFGTILVYLTAPFIIDVLNVKFVFLISGIIAFAMSALWISVCNKHKVFSVLSENICDIDKTTGSSAEKSKMTGNTIVVLSFIMLAVLLQGMLRDGVTNWTPTYISESFNLDSSSSILTGVVLPVFSVLSFSFVSFLNRKFIKNEIVCAGAIFAVGAVSAVFLKLCGDGSLIISLLLLALLVGSMHGVNLILVCTTPAFFAKQGRVSFISGLVNSCTYAGAAVSTYIIALFTDKFGWDLTITLWIIIAFIGSVVCISSFKRWNLLKKEN